ncbi:uncharacterized protein LOC131249463 [Magnolia sinica]|uniref:uncharacterized protein LOC131249463 n=1 Tax=Magnolia sinica TaxID=86752 RepID=UPI00265AC3A9|nr:uncharacterized protein LOC131249463 [Magnolia sinica]
MVHLLCKLKSTKQALKVWNRDSLRNIFSQIKATSARVDRLEQESITSPTMTILSNLDSERRSLLKAHIREIKLLNGTTTDDQAQIKAAAVEFFKGLFASEEVASLADFLSPIPSLISVEDNAYLMTQLTLEEVKSAVSAILVDGAPDPYEFFGSFFSACWSIIGEDLHHAVKFLFQGGNIPRAFSSSLLFLILKIPVPRSFSDFRPISLCNCIYKVFSKVIAARLSSILLRIVSAEQMAFVQGRSIANNISLV